MPQNFIAIILALCLISVMRKAGRNAVFLAGVFCAMLMFAPHGVRADDQKLFVPTSSWLVGPASPVAASEGDTKKLPCVMINQYDNGFTFRLSGGGGSLMAMAVDFRQKVFKPGKSYRVDIEVPPYVDVALPGTAYNEATLIVNTQQIDGFYKNISEAKTMKLGVGSSKMDFALLGVSDGLSRVESCYSGSKAGQQQQHQPQQPQQPQQPVQAENGFKAAPSIEDLMEAEEPSVITPMPDEAASPVGNGAETAMHVDKMLQDAAMEMKRIEPAAAPAPTPSDKSDMPVKATSEGQMLARSWASPFVQQDRKPAQRTIMASTSGKSGAAGDAAGAQSAGDDIRSWRALGGTSLQEALSAWAGEANVELMWMAGQDFSIAKSISLQGSFEAAVLSILEQYGDADPRPVGRIYNDSSAGRKVLLVEVHRDY